MPTTLYQQLLTALKAHGFVLKRSGKGSHEIWWNPHTTMQITVPRSTKSRHTINAILKQAGIQHKF